MRTGCDDLAEIEIFVNAIELVILKTTNESYFDIHSRDVTVY